MAFLVRTGKHLVLVDHFISTKSREKELTACLLAIVHLFQRGCISEITLQFLDKVIAIAKSDAQPEQVKYALSILIKILYNRSESFTTWKEEVML